MKIRSLRNGFTLIRTLRSKNLIRVQSAFTLIELLVVISIIGILAAVVTVSFTSAQKQARDTQRKSDLSQYRSSLEIFANKNDGLYPVKLVITEASSGLCTSLGLTDCPKDPKDPDKTYKYCSDTGGTKYAIWATPENSTYWTVCSDGRSKVSTNIPACGASFNCNLP